MPTPAELADEYLAGVEKLRAAVAGLTPEQFVARPVPGKWSTLEVLAHLADFEPIFSDRIKRTLAFDDALLLAVDDKQFAAALHYQDRDPAEELAVIVAIRTSLARLLRKLPTDALARVGRHSEAGPRTLEQLVRGAINHVNHHLPFILEKRAALGLS